MKPYNGFPPEQRYRALAWLKRQVKLRQRVDPTECEACGQVEGVIQAHSEDYSDPFGPNIGQFSFCYRCHMMLHCRFRARAAWDYYREQVRRGRRAAAIRSHTTGFGEIQEALQGRQPSWTQNTPPYRRVLDEIELGVWRQPRPRAANEGA